MPVPALDLEKWQIAIHDLWGKFLAGKPLSPFDAQRYELYADKISRAMPAESLQLKGILAIFADNEDAFHKYFKNAINISANPLLDKVNYILALVHYGDYETAGDLLSEIASAKDMPLDSAVLTVCIECCDIMDNVELLAKFVSIAANMKDIPDDLKEAIERLIGYYIPDDNPALTCIINSYNGAEIATDSDETLKQMLNFAKELEANARN